MDWFKKHVDAVIVLTGILGTVFWMNGKFNEIERRFSGVERDIAIMKTVLVMHKIMPQEIVASEEK